MMVLSAENPELSKVLPLKLGAGHKICILGSGDSSKVRAPDS